VIDVLPASDEPPHGHASHALAAPSENVFARHVRHPTPDPGEYFPAGHDWHVSPNLKIAPEYPGPVQLHEVLFAGEVEYEGQWKQEV
jgi:hypothetical protein